MKTVISNPKELSFADYMALTMDDDALPLRTAIGSELALKQYIITTEEREDVTVQILGISDGEKVYRTTSKSFIKSFTDLIDIASEIGQEIHHIKVCSGTSKRGRTFMTCKLID